MTTTTPGTLRTTIAARIVALTPSLDSEVLFREHREEDSFREWALNNPAGCLRRFSVRQGPRVEQPTVTDGLTEMVAQEFEILVAYPTDGRFGALKMADLDNAVERDRAQIAKTIGTNGTAYTDATVTTEDEDREDIGPVTVGVVRLLARYFRSATP